MKDPNDKRTIDGFGDLLQGLDEQPVEEAPVRPSVAFSDLAKLIEHVAEKHGITLDKPLSGKPKGKPGPKPKSGETMSGAERAKAFRDRKRAAKKAEEERLEAIRTGKPVTSALIDLDTSFADQYRKTRANPGANPDA